MKKKFKMSEIERLFLFQSKTEREKTIPNKKKESEKDILEDYIIGQTLGEGTFGKVKLARHKITKEKVN